MNLYPENWVPCVSIGTGLLVFATLSYLNPINMATKA